MKMIKLSKAAWLYDPSITLGPAGGFGEVFFGRSENGEEVAIKKLHISSTSAGNRELDISKELEGKNLPHIIPFYDSGVDAETMDYFVVMAKAESSLQQLIDNGPVSEKDAVKILTDIAQGLNDVEEIVHRDLKPGNVLYHENCWKLADFGIARFIEKSTSLNTLKGYLSHFYAAPEQWRLERATKATDVYAFGCISFALITGQPPFLDGDLRRRHLSEEPQRTNASPRMQQLISLCLRKNPSARPSVESLRKQLAGLSEINYKPNNALVSAGAAVAADEAIKEAEITRKRTEEENRRELAQDAVKSLDAILEMLFDAIESDAPVAIRSSKREIILGNGKLRVEISFEFLIKEAFKNSKKNIVCGALIILDQDAVHYQGRSANLWFGEFTVGEFRWWEIPYFRLQGRGRYEPFGISQLSEMSDADYAASPVSHNVSHAATPQPIDADCVEKFIERWCARLAKAAVKKLQRPGSLPEE